MKCLWIFICCNFLINVNANYPGKLCSLDSDTMQSEGNSKQCYMKEILAALPHSPNQITVDRKRNILYFSFDSGQGEYVPAVLKIDSKKLGVLKGIRDAFAIAYDSVSGEIFFGGSYGIYRYNSAQQKCHRLARDNLDIWWLTIQKHIYFIKFPSLNAYYYANKTIRSVTSLDNVNVQQFVFDKDAHIFFINSSGLYGVRDDDNNHVLLRDSPKFVSIAADSNGFVYVCSEDGIFVVSKVNQKVKRIVNIQGVLALAFDRDNNIVYSDSHEIIRLLPVTQEKYYANNNLF